MRYLQISLQLRLRGLQLDERPRGLGDHFLQQVIIWAKSRACQAQLAGSAALSAPACARPDRPGTFVPQKSGPPAPRVHLEPPALTESSTSPFLEEFPSTTPFSARRTPDLLLSLYATVCDCTFVCAIVSHCSPRENVGLGFIHTFLLTLRPEPGTEETLSNEVPSEGADD